MGELRSNAAICDWIDAGLDGSKKLDVVSLSSPA